MLDFEAGQVYGIRGSQITIPTEIGMVLYDPAEDTVSYMQEKFASDIDLVVRKNITDSDGVKKRVSVNVINQKRDLYDIKYDRRHRAGAADIRRAVKVSGDVHASVKDYMNAIEREYEISSFWFFSDVMERDIFKKASYDLSAYEVYDLQRIIKKNCPGMPCLPSLDKLSAAHNFKVGRDEIITSNFRYNFPERKRDLFKIHRALGDAARIFMLNKEFLRDNEEFARRTIGHMKKCGDIRCKNE